MASLTDTVMATAKIANLSLSNAAQFFSDTSETDDPWQILRVAVTQDAFLNFDGSTVSAANGEFWPAGTVEYKKVPRGASIGFIRSTTDGRITISRMV